MSLIGTSISASSSTSTSTARLTTAQKLSSTSSGLYGSNDDLQTAFYADQSATNSSSSPTSSTQNGILPASSVPVINPIDADTSAVSAAEGQVQANLVTNPLNAYDQATYFITFSLLSDDINNSQQIIIAETGDTNLNILSLVLDTHPACSAITRNSTASNIELRLYEAMGSNLPDLLLLSAQSLNIKNYTKALFRITVRFQGYDPTTGQPNTNIGGKTWQWTCVLINIASRVDESGTTHTLSFGWIDDIAKADQYAKLPQALTAVKAPKATVGSALNAMIQKMNADVIKTYGYAHIVYAVEQVPYRQPIASISNPFDNPIYSPDNPAWQSSRNNDNIQVAGGTSFMSFVDHIFASSPTATKMVASSNRIHDTDNSKNLDVVSTFHIVDTLVTYGPFNSQINDYDKNITYVIRPYETVRVFTNIEQALQSNDSTKTQQKASFLVQNNYINKGYDYVYTGNNTEVLKFDIDLNFSYLLVTDMKLGEVHYHQTTIPKSFNSKALQRTATTPTDMSNTSTSHTSQNTDTSTSTSVTPSNTSSSSSSSGRLTTQSKLNSSVSTVTYADDLASLTSTTFNTMPITIAQGGVNHRAQVNSFTEADWTAQRSIYGILLDQLYEGGAGDAGALMQIQIEIRGDPYWLGNDLDDQIAATYANSVSTSSNGPVPGAAINSNSNASSTVGSNTTNTNSQTINSTTIYNTSKNAANYLVGENVFVFRFNFPQGYNENTGSATLSESDMFTGFYSTIQVTNTFENGQFTQVLTGVRLVGMQVSQLLNISYGP